MKVNGYVYRAVSPALQMWSSVTSITDVKLVTLLHSSLIVSAKSAFAYKQYAEAEELLHDANHLAEQISQYNTATEEDK